MHDLHVADRIHKLVIETANKNNLKKVTKINVELGIVEEHGAAISPENLKVNIAMLSRDTVCEEAEVNIKEVSGNTWKLVSIDGE